MINFAGFIHKYAELGVADGDSDDEIIKKRMLSFLPLIIGIVATIWGITYILLGHYVSASIPLSYAVISVANLWHFFITKKLWFLQNSQLLLVLFLPFFLMWSLGGFANGSFMLIWAFFAPVAAMAFEKNKNAFWITAFFALIFLSVFLDSFFIKQITPLSQGWISAFFLLNSVVGFGGIYFMFRYYIQDKERRSELNIFKEHQKLLLKSQELADVNLKLEQIATHDHLTGLENRLSFLDKMNSSIYLANENKRRLALFFIDLDRFKQINDTLGHAVGDSVLVHISRILREYVCHGDVVARLGGDEFVVLVDKFDSMDELSGLAEKIIDAVRQIIYLQEHELHITCSIGISIYPDDIDGASSESSANMLLRNADTAMYKAKDEGKNTFQYYQAYMTVHAKERMQIERDMRNALIEDQFVVYYQPQIDAMSERVTGMEALVRWNHPSKGFIQPYSFIPLAEEIGLIVLIDRVVMKKAMVQFVKWYKDGLHPGVLSLNLSVRQLEQEDFLEYILKTMHETEFHASWLEFEVTEGYIMSNPEKSITTLENISKFGISISIDDFGTGYSSLAYLKRLPIDKLKIDKSFVDGLPNDESDIKIIKTIIGLAVGMELDLIAEGVETLEQKNFLVELGCNSMQGYYYAKPMADIDIKAYLSSFTAS